MMTIENPSGRGAAFVRVLMPAAAPSVILVLGRWWHAEGAAHSVGDAALMTVLAAAAGGAAVAVRGNGALPAYCVGAAGGLAAAAIAGYASGLALPLIAWAVATALTAAAALRSRRADARDMERERLHADTAIQREAIRAQSRIEVAAITGAWQARAAAITAAASPAASALQFDRRLLDLSPEARAALDSPTARLALESPRTAAREETGPCDATPLSEPTVSAPLWRAS